MQLLTTIRSESVDPRTFLLSPYIFDTKAIYSIIIGTHIQGKPKETATDIVQINVGVSGVVASIAGGSQFTTSNDLPFTLDASGSYDIDYPVGGSLSYTWKCSGYSPNFGVACPPNIVLSSVPILTIPAKSFVVSNTISPTIMFSVLVENSYNASSLASVLVTLVKGEIATGVIETPTSKFNSKSAIVVAADITVPSGFDATASWNTTSIPFTVFNSAVQGSVRAEFVSNSISRFYLVLSPGHLSAGATYTFSLTVVGDSGTRTSSATSSVTVTINSPPVGGALSITPQSGTALQTVPSFILKMILMFTDSKLFIISDLYVFNVFLV